MTISAKNLNINVYDSIYSYQPIRTFTTTNQKAAHRFLNMLEARCAPASVHAEDGRVMFSNYPNMFLGTVDNREIALGLWQCGDVTWRIYSK